MLVNYQMFRNGKGLNLSLHMPIQPDTMPMRVFRKDGSGRWVSGDPFKQGIEKYAGTGKVPKQSVIPEDIAEQFLSSDGKYWQAWRDVDNTQVIPTLHIFRIKQQFRYPTATIAMRVPYTYTYFISFINKLKEHINKSIYIDKIGTTTNNRPIFVIRIEDPTRNTNT